MTKRLVLAALCSALATASAAQQEVLLGQLGTTPSSWACQISETVQRPKYELISYTEVTLVVSPDGTAWGKGFVRDGALNETNVTYTGNWSLDGEVLRIDAKTLVHENPDPFVFEGRILNKRFIGTNSNITRDDGSVMQRSVSCSKTSF